MITKGGDAPNVVPAHASAKILAMALEYAVMNDVVRKVENISRGLS